MKKRTHFTAVVLQCQQKLDVVNSCALIEQVYEAYLAGIRQIVVDMSHTEGISEYGFATLWRIVYLLQQREVADKVYSPNQASNQHKLLQSHTIEHAPKLQIRNAQPHLTEMLTAQGFAEVADIQTTWYTAAEQPNVEFHRRIFG
jgi:anti-anti-sigma regulatory factor